MSVEAVQVPPRKRAGQAGTPRRFDGQLLDVASAAKYLGTSEKCIRSRVSRRLLPYKRMGGRVLFVRVELDAYLSALGGCGVDEAVENERVRRGSDDSRDH